MSQPNFTAIGIDVGRTKIAAGLVKLPDGTVHFRRIIPTQPKRGGEAVLLDIERIVKALVEEASAAKHRVDGIGVGVCEIVDLSGRIASSNCLDWQGLTVTERFSRIAPTILEADVRAAARAEALVGAGRNARVFLYATIGTGISSCLMIDGQPFTGARGATGTMASGPLPGFREGTSKTLLPSLEEIASGPALLSRFRALHRVAETGRDVLAAAALGDEQAANIVRSAAAALGASVGALVNVLDPDLVVLGGGLGLSEGLYRETLISSARQHIWWPGHRELAIVAAQTGADAGIIGAAVAAWTKSQGSKGTL